MKSRRAPTRIITLLLISLTLLIPVPSAQAAGTIRRVTPNGTATVTCGGTWATACSLQFALTNAASGTELWVMSGAYTPTAEANRTVSFQLRTGIALYGGFAGTETGRNQRDFTTHVTILSGDIGEQDDDTDNSYNVVTANGTDATAVLDGFWVTGGRATEDSNPLGGGMYNFFSNPRLENVTFIDNVADNGGGMYNNTSNPTIKNVTFIDNGALLGGGMYNNTSSPTLENVTFDDSFAQYGGGMYNDQSSPMLENVTFSANRAPWHGGGMYNDNNSSPSLNNVTFNANDAGSGGGMTNYDNSSPTLTNVTFSANLSVKGGGMYNSTNSNPTLDNVTFYDNVAVNGGGDSDGGGMYNTGSSPTLTNVTFSANSAADGGGGMYNTGSSSPVVTNSLLWGNTAAEASFAQILNLNSNPNFAHSVVQGGCPSGSTCDYIIDADPHLGALGDWGGFTQTIPLLPGSSAIDTGNDVTCATTDQRGIVRPYGAHCDIGAFEWTHSMSYIPYIAR